MNRLVIIGNGFDLAHGLKTSYRDFIHWYMHDCFERAFDKRKYEDQLIKIIPGDYRHRDEKERFQWVEKYLSNFAYTRAKITSIFGGSGSQDTTQYFSVDFRSDFLKLLLKSCSTAKWVDIEGIFYEQMILILDSKGNDQAKEVELQKLNGSMRGVIDQLQRYLTGINPPRKIASYDDIIYSRIDAKDIQSKPIKIRTAYNLPFETSQPKEILILNFNYTETTSCYLSAPNYRSLTTISIHGQLNNLDNPIIFGFGDELDRRYVDIENSSAQGWFEYIKSFWYLKTNNYRDLTSFIDSDEYQVVVLGHSSGLSDRTMLQMIFQHDNCRSIKLYYYGDKQKNNFKQTLHEVARHFKDKGLMRRRIVSEENSQRMPQYDD